MGKMNAYGFRKCAERLVFGRLCLLDFYRYCRFLLNRIFHFLP